MFIYSTITRLVEVHIGLLITITTEVLLVQLTESKALRRGSSQFPRRAGRKGGTLWSSRLCVQPLISSSFTYLLLPVQRQQNIPLTLRCCFVNSEIWNTTINFAGPVFLALRAIMFRIGPNSLQFYNSRYCLNSFWW